jgi:hypothetical protein
LIGIEPLKFGTVYNSHAIVTSFSPMNVARTVYAWDGSGRFCADQRIVSVPGSGHLHEWRVSSSCQLIE